MIAYELILERLKTASMPTLAMTAASQANHLRRAGAFAQRTQGVAKDVVASTNHALANFKPKAPVAIPRPAPNAIAQVARKTTPTQAIDGMALPRHLAKTNPEQAIQAGRQYGAKVVGNASVLDQLSRTSFDKLARRR